MAIRILTWLLAFVFIAAGAVKVIGLEQPVQEFEHMGYSAWFRILIGALEVAGGVGLLVPGLAFAAALGLIGIMIGAVWTLFSIGQAPVPPLVVGVLLGVVAAAKRPA